ncbi:glycosyltransferase family 39 protein [Candidatus Azambacteria bacterium]|nr:glycosyltransferase family 39 protein [Candidatus Azambacteria bacterium]
MKKINLLAAAFLTIFGLLAFTSMWNDNANYDERIHLPAGYSYITQQDMRLNPEHPPLVKDLAALPLFFIKINFPYKSWGWNTPLSVDSSRTPAWQTDVGFGNDLLYFSGNDAQNMMRLARIPMILIGLLLGFYIFKFSKELWGDWAGLIALALYSFSPTFLAHTRLVTTDVAAAAAFFISFYYLYKWLKLPTLRPSKNGGGRNLWIFGIVLGLSLLTKFSTILLIPIFGFIVLVWILLQESGEKLRALKKYLGGFVLVLMIAFLVIGAVYAFHVRNYPAQKQAIDTDFILSTFGFKPLADLSVWISSQPILRAWGQYFLGFLMVLQRSGGGNTTYYLGSISADGSHSYFPTVYMLKEPLTYILLEFFALFLALKKFIAYKKSGGALFGRDFSNLLKNNFAEFGMLAVIFVYWALSIKSNLNIGVRHILPSLPFIYALTARQISFWIKGSITERIADYRGFWQLFSLHWRRIKKGFVVAVLLIWAVISVVSVWPSFLAYFNEIAGGPDGGYKFVVDSNLDWGQDILRLSRFIEKNNIKEIKMDYFSGAPAEYYIKTAKIDSYNREIPQKGWLAVSATIYMGACKGDKIPCSYNERAYTWLDAYKPVAKIGYSIFVYKID